MDSKNLNILMAENQSMFDWLHQGELISKPEFPLSSTQIFDYSLNSFSGIPYDQYVDSTMELIPYETQHLLSPQDEDFYYNSNGDFHWFDNYFPSSAIDSASFDNNVWQDFNENPTKIEKETVSTCSKDEERMNNKCSGRSKSVTINFDEIARHFNVPITKAAKNLKVGLTALKKRCRQLNIERWPHRKIQSLKSLIDNLKELGLSSEEIEMLEEHKKLMEKMPQMELTEGTKKIRQACFKVNYKRRRSLATLS